MAKVTVFEAIPPEGYEWILPERQEDFDLLRFNGAPRLAYWAPIRMKLHREGSGEFGRDWRRCESDFPHLGGGELILRERALTALRSLLENYGELLPLICADTTVWLFNVTTVVPGLDQDRSQLERMDSGKVIKINKPAFRKHVVQDLAVFKVPEALYGKIYFGEEFVQKVRSSRLAGLDFKPVWTSADDA